MLRRILARFAAWRTPPFDPASDALLIAYADRVARLHANTPPRCEACDAYGQLDGLAVAYRADRPHTKESLLTVCIGCAAEHGLDALPVRVGVELHRSAEPVERAPIAVIDVGSERDEEPVEPDEYRYISPRRTPRRATF